MTPRAEGSPPVRAELKALATIAGPLAVALLAEMAMSFTDLAVVGRLGNLELAAVGLAGNIFFSLLFVCMGLVSIVGVHVAEAAAVHDPEHGARSVRQGFWVAFVVSVPATALAWYLGPILRALRQDEAVIVVAEEYLRAVAWCFLPYMWFTVLRNFVSPLARVGAVTVICIGGVALNFGANYVLVFGKFGFPALGVAGSGYATSLVCWAMALALLVYASRCRELRAYPILARLGRIDFRLWRQMLAFGLPVAGGAAVESALFSTVAVLMGVLGPITLAANQIAYNFWGLIYVVPYSLSLAASYRVAHGIARGEPRAARQAGLLAMVGGAGYAMVVAGFIWIAPQSVVGLYLDADSAGNAEVVSLAVALLGLLAVFQLMDGAQVIAAGALRGLKDTALPLFAGILGYWVVGLGSGYWLAFRLGYGARGLWWGLAMGLAVAATLLTSRFLVLSRRGQAGGSSS